MIGRTLGHYRIEELVGAGGMGEVYRATDLALGRTAAIKVLPPGFDPELRQRLRREAEACGRLQHPAIASLLEAGEANGVDFLAMEFVPGENLRARLSRGPLPMAEALAIATAMLEALGHAHAAGIVHRDVKPENLIVVGPRKAKLTDFGIARRVSGGTRTIAHGGSTEAGTLLGTVGYLAPEQIRGEPADGRSDLFAAGAVLYEMLAGRPAFTGGSITERLAATLAADPPPLDDVPAPLNAVLRRALDRDPERRYGSAREFLSDLVAASAGEAVSTLPDTIAILDFETRSSDPADAWIGGAVAETLASDLARLGGVRALPHPAVARARAAAGASADAVHVGLLLGCRWIVHGSVQKVGEALRVVLAVDEPPTGRVMLREKLSGAMAELFEIQDRIAGRVVEALALQTRERVEPEGRRRLDAYACWARGREEWLSMQKARFENAVEWFTAAIERDPDYPDALVGLAMVHDMRFTFLTDPADLASAEDYARRAIAAAPVHAQAHVWLAYALWRLGRIDEALAAVRRAGELDPHDHYPPYFEACMHMDRGAPADALPLYQRTVAHGPDFGFAWVGLGNAHMENGAFDEAAWCLGRSIALEPTGRHATAGAAGYLAECHRRAGRLVEARAEALTGVEAAESTDHMYRDTFRALSLNALGRTALDQDDRPAAAAAFRQCETHLRGRVRTLGGGFLLCQALAGRAAAERDAAPLDEAARRLASRDAMNWSWLWLCEGRQTVADCERASRALGGAAAAPPAS